MSKGDKTDEAATKAEVNKAHQTVTRRSKRKRGDNEVIDLTM